MRATAHPFCRAPTPRRPRSRAASRSSWRPHSSWRRWTPRSSRRRCLRSRGASANRRSALTASITVYLVAMAVFVPSAGWASDRFDARNLFAAAVAVFTLASLLCGISPTFWALIASRLLQGAAAAFMSPVGRLIVLRETPKHQIIDAIGLDRLAGADRARRRAAARRIHHDLRVVALDLPHQHSARHRSACILVLAIRAAAHGGPRPRRFDAPGIRAHRRGAGGADPRTVARRARRCGVAARRRARRLRARLRIRRRPARPPSRRPDARPRGGAHTDVRAHHRDRGIRRRASRSA